MSIQETREKRTVLAKEYRHILDNNKGKLTDDEKAKLDTLQADIVDLEDRIEREQNILDFEAERLETEKVAEHLKEKTGSPSAKALLNKWIVSGDNALTAEDWTHIRNTMSTTTDGQGGYTVQTEVAGTVLDALKKYGGMRNVAEVIRTDQGNPMNWPTSDGTAEEGEIVAENTEVADADISFGVKSLPVYKYSSKVVTVPIELLQDTEIDMEAFVNKRIAQRLGRITNKHFTVGTGTGQPLGLIAGVTVGKTAAANATFTYLELLDLEHSVDPAYRESSGCKFMFNDAALKIVRQLQDSDGRPLWLPSLSDEAPATLLGYGYQVNQDVAAPATAAKSIAFGDMSKYVIRDVMQITYHRFTDSAYAKKGQVGFLAFLRSGGNYMDVGGAVKVLQQKLT